MNEEIQKYLRMQNADHTRKQYSLVLNRFSKFYKDNLPEETNWPKTYTDHLVTLELKNRTVNYHLTVIKGFWKYLTGNVLNVHRLKEAKAKVDFFSDSEVASIIAKADPAFKGLLMFMFDTGVRVSEAQAVSKTIYDSVPNKFIITGKGGKQRLLLISDKTKSYLTSIAREGKIFSQEWTVERIQRTLKGLASSVGITRTVHPHMTRHTFATKMLNNGINIVEVKDMLGHESLATTQIYTHITAERLESSWSKVLNQKQEATAVKI